MIKWIEKKNEPDGEAVTFITHLTLIVACRGERWTSVRTELSGKFNFLIMTMLTFVL